MKPARTHREQDAQGQQIHANRAGRNFTDALKEKTKLSAAERPTSFSSSLLWKSNDPTQVTSGKPPSLVSGKIHEVPQKYGMQAMVGLRMLCQPNCGLLGRIVAARCISLQLRIRTAAT
ncbi:hypothetical protein NDU88_006763 [Pleurodeles waltl]|uniref:Uncharacterized protein n=1 Tax=Pleurodeles waltl TaxID=8319 RepID=A0AAV7QMQ5_PLEWA|nr:hypothetical protein NDU88_006763 [Pleurodeles waltl]